MKSAKIWEIIFVRIMSGVLSIEAGIFLFINNPMELPVILETIIVLIAIIVVFIAVLYIGMIDRYIFENPKMNTEA